MNNMRPFEIILIGFFGVVAVTGLIFLSLYQSKPSAEEQLYGDKVVIWGMFDQGSMDDFLFEMTNVSKAFKVVSYTQIDPRNFENEFINAVAEGNAPDLIMIPHSLLVSVRTKLIPVSFETLPQRTFKDTYIDGADIFMRNDGIYGVPFAVDPLIMFWNRDIFSSAGLSQAPKTWENIVTQTTHALVQKNDANQILQGALAFGEYQNIAHAKEILSMLFLQTGSSIVIDKGEAYTVTLNNTENNGSAEAVLNFYTQFSLPSNNLYTWNRSKKLDRDEFTAGKLAMYFGFGSEISTIERENPNLNYDVARVPQGAGATTLRTYGEFYAFAIPKASQHAKGAYAVALALSSTQHAQTLVEMLNLTPVRRELYLQNTSDPLKDVLFQSSLIARGWLDPNPQGSNKVFADMVEEVTSSGGRLKSVILDTVHRLEALF